MLDGKRLILPDKVLDDLRMEIVSQKRAAGDPLIEEELGRRYGVSRGSVRTAIRELENEGLVRIHPNGRKEVIGFTVKQARDVYDLRWQLENRATEVIFEESTSYFTPMADVLRKIEIGKQGKDTNWFLMDILFHQALVLAAQNHPLYMAWKTNINVMYALMKLNVVQGRQEYQEGFLTQHRELFTGIISHNEGVFSLLKEHILSARP